MCRMYLLVCCVCVCVCVYICMYIRVYAYVYMCMWYTTRKTDDRAPLTPEPHGVGLGAREWLWRAEGWLMHATTIASQHAALLYSYPPPSCISFLSCRSLWHKSGKHRFARTGAETFLWKRPNSLVVADFKAAISLFLFVCFFPPLFPLFLDFSSFFHFIKIITRCKVLSILLTLWSRDYISWSAKIS